MSEKFSPRKLSESVDSTASRVLKGLQAPSNIPHAKTSREELSARVLEKAAQIRERAQQLAQNPRNEYERDIQRRIEERIKENEQSTRMFKVKERAAKITARAQQVMENPRSEYERDIKKRVEAQILENKNKARINKAKELAGKITARAKQVTENPKDAYERDLKKRIEARRRIAGRPLSEKGNLVHEQPKDNVLFDLDEGVVSYEDEGVPLRGRFEADKTQEIDMNDIFASDAEKKKAQEVAYRVEDTVRKVKAQQTWKGYENRTGKKPSFVQPEEKVLFDLDEDVVSYEDEGVPLRGRFEGDKTQEIDMNDIFAEESRRKSASKNEKRAFVNRSAIEQKQQTMVAARKAIRELGFEPHDVPLILDEDFVARLKKRGYTGAETSVLASVAKEKANDLRSYFKVMGVTIDRYGEPDLGFLKKLGGLFGGYNKKVGEIKRSEDFQRMKLLDMLALDADEVLSAPRRNPSTFGKKAVLAGAAAAAIGGAMMKGKGQPDVFSSRAVAAQSMRSPSEKVAPAQREEIPEYDFTESEAGYDGDFGDTKEKEFPEYSKLSAPEERKVNKNSVRRDAARIVENAAYSEKEMSSDLKMNMLEDFFKSKEFKNLPKDIRQKMIYALVGGSIVLEPAAFKESLDTLKKSMSKLPNSGKEMSSNEILKLLEQVTGIAKRKLE